MLWKKSGRIYTPKSVHPKLVSHAANPLPVLLEDDIYRVFYSGRDVENRSSVGFVDIDIVRQKIIHQCDKPIFEHGGENSFYSHGVSIGNCYEVDGSRYILFMGWQCPADGHWRGDVGRLRLNDDLSLTLDSDTPFMATDSTDQVSLSYPWVLKEANGLYSMWYGSTMTWDAGNNEMLHVLNYASSTDGHSWKRKGLSVPYELGVAQAFSRPSVMQGTNGDYHMWFSYRSGSGEKYRIGYAYSNNGKSWELRLDDAGINVSISGWDSEMIEYPFVLNHKNQYYMLYNGNGYGKTGFGIAALVNE